MKARVIQGSELINTFDVCYLTTGWSQKTNSKLPEFKEKYSVVFVLS